MAMKRISGLLVVVLLLVGLCACEQSTEAQWREQYDLGVRFLSEGNYEEAVIAFTAAIEIDPNQEILYEKLSEVYLQDGDVSAALQILRDGFKVTRSIHLQEVIDNLYARMDLILGEYYLTEDWVKADEWTINGVPFWQASQNDVATAYATSWSSWKPFPDGPETLHYNTQRSDFFWDTEANVLQVMFFDNHKHSNTAEGQAAADPILPSRGITTDTNFESILQAVGLSADGISYVSKQFSDAEENVIAVSIAADTEDYRATFSGGWDDDEKQFRIDYVFQSGMTMSVNFLFGIDSNELDNGSITLKLE